MENPSVRPYRHYSLVFPPKRQYNKDRKGVIFINTDKNEKPGITGEEYLRGLLKDASQKITAKSIGYERRKKYEVDTQNNHKNHP